MERYYNNLRRILFRPATKSDISNTISCIINGVQLHFLLVINAVIMVNVGPMLRRF